MKKTPYYITKKAIQWYFKVYLFIPKTCSWENPQEKSHTDHGSDLTSHLTDYSGFSLNNAIRRDMYKNQSEKETNLSGYISLKIIGLEYLQILPKCQSKMRLKEGVIH